MKNDAANTLNALLLILFAIFLLLLLWPFAEWEGKQSLIFKVIASLSAQALLCKIGKHMVIRAIPVILSGILAF